MKTTIKFIMLMAIIAIATTSCKKTIYADEIIITPDNVLLQVGKTITLTAEFVPSNTTDQNIFWLSSNENIATIDAKTGVLTGISGGTAIITASTGSAFVNKTITVTWFSSGDGSAGNPYIINTPAELDAVRANLSAHYKLGANIDLSDYLASGGAGFAKWGENGWAPIGNNNDQFKGSLDGAGFKISGIWINRPSQSLIGLFGCIYNTTIKNLGVEIANDKGGIKGNDFVGGLAGSSLRTEVGITKCYVIGDVSGKNNVGGMIGSGGKITNCYTTGNVSGNDYVGGISGDGANMTSSYSACVVNGSTSVGGMAGMGSATNCVALNPLVKAANGLCGRIEGFNAGTFINCWGSNTMMVIWINNIKTLNKGGNKNDGADCAEMPSASWWTTAAPNGPGWSATDWIFTNGQLPKLRY